MAFILHLALRSPCTRWLSAPPRRRRSAVQRLLFTQSQPNPPASLLSLRSYPEDNALHSHALNGLPDCLPTEALPSRTSYLKKLSVQDFILVKKEEVHFDPGFNVITGESGGGKSMLIEALSQLLGKTSAGSCVRRSCETAAVEGTFQLAPNGLKKVRALLRQLDAPQRALSELEGESGGELVIRREISRTKSGQRSRCYVNGIATSVKFLKALSELFFDVNGQHSVTQLGNKQKQLALIDQIAGQSELKEEISAVYTRMTELKSLLSITSEFENEEIRAEAQKLVDDIHGSKIDIGEERNLRYTLQVLETHASSVEAATITVSNLIGQGGSEGIVDALQEVTGRVKAIVRQEHKNDELSDDEDEVENVCEEGISCALKRLDEALLHLEKAHDEVEKAADDVSDFAAIMKFDPVDQAEIRQRLKFIDKLLNDYDCSSTRELIELANETQGRLDQYYASFDKRTDWESELAALEEQYIHKSVRLSRRRREVAGKLRKVIEDCLYDLAMQKSRFDVHVTWEQTNKKDGVYVTSEMAKDANERGDDRYKATANGFDSVEFLLAPGPSEPLRALSAVASGGECARIMLAFKAAPVLIQGTVMDEESEYETSSDVLVLDELDTGVGSRLGKTVGRLLRSICTQSDVAGNQVICISHIPHVAVYAAHHIKAWKSDTDDGSTEIRFRELKQEEEILEEINAMIGSSQNVAVELLNQAKEKAM